MIGTADTGDEHRDFGAITDLAGLAAALRWLKRRQARRVHDSELTVRELAARSGYSIGAISTYLNGSTLPPVDRFDVLLQILDASPGEMRQLATAHERVSETRRSGKRPDPTEPQLSTSNLPPRNHRFVGRQQELRTITDHFDKSRVRQALTGMGGVGKSQLALEYAHRNAGRYNLAWLFHAEYPDLLPGQFATLAERLGLCDTPENAPALSDILAHLTKVSCCLIFDNACDPDALTAFLPDAAHVLITTRSKAFGGIARILYVDVLARPDAVRLLRSRQSDIPAADAHELADLLGDLPIAIEQAAAYMEATGCPVDVYKETVARQTERVLDKGNVVGYRHTLDTVWDLSLDQISTTRPDALSLLTLAGYLDGAPIPVDVFRAGRHLLAPPLSDQVDDPFGFADTIGVLVRLSLARRDTESFTVHRLIQAAIRKYVAHGLPQPSDAEQVTVVRLMGILRHAAPETIWSDVIAMARWRALLPHILTVVNRYRRGAAGLADAAWLYDHAGTYLHAAGQAEAALPLLRSAVELSSRTDGSSSPVSMSTRQNLAIALRDSGDYQAAEATYREILEHNEAHYGNDSLEAAAVAAELGTVCLYQGAYAQARTYIVRNLTIRHRVLGPDHTDTFGAQNDLACLHIMQKEFDLAEQLLRHVHDGWRRLHGEGHRRTLNALNNLCIVLAERGKLAEAEALMRTLWDIRVRVHGAEHPNTLAAKANLAQLLQAQTRYPEARRMLTEVLDSDRAIHGDDHPHTLTAMHRVGAVLADEGDTARARQFLAGALYGRERVLGFDHPDTIASRTALADLDN